MYEQTHTLPSGATLDIIQPIDDNHEYHYWYGGDVAEVTYKGFTFVLGAYGDVRTTLIRKKDNSELAYVKDKSNGGYFYNEMSPYIADDIELDKLLTFTHPENTLEIDNNNWWEYYIITPTDYIIDMCDICNSCRYSEALNEMIDNIENFVNEYEHYQKETT